MTVKQLECHISRTEGALEREKQKNNEKMARMGWGYGFWKKHTGPCCAKELEQKERLRGLRAQHRVLKPGAGGVKELPER